MSDNKTTIHELKQVVKKFCDDRNWSQFHDAKELAIGISTEAGELLDHFRFKSVDEVKNVFQNLDKKKQISEELSDVLYFVLRFADVYDLDLTTELKSKIELNCKKYPVEKAKNCNKKYNEY